MIDPSKLQHSMMPTLVHPVARALEQEGVDAQQLFQEVGIQLGQKGVPDERIPQSRFSALMGRAVEETGDEAFGLHAAQHLQPQVLMALGLSWLASDTIYDGLQRMARFARCISTGAFITLEEQGDYLHAWLLGRLYPPKPVHASRDYGVGIIMQMCRHTLGEELHSVQACIDRPHPSNPELWQRLFGEGVQFDAPHTRISWHLEDVEKRLAAGNPSLARVTDERAQAYLDGLLSHSITRDVVDKVLVELPDGVPPQASVAKALNLSGRTMQRRLSEEGTSYAEVIREMRLQLAKAYLRGQDKSVLETAYLLGYSEPSTFSRAFKSWTGTSPAQFRKSAF